MKNLSKKEINEIKYLASQGNKEINRVRLITNLYNLTLDDLRCILLNP